MRELWQMLAACMIPLAVGASAARADYLYIIGDPRPGPSPVVEVPPDPLFVHPIADGFLSRGLAFAGDGFLYSINAGVVSKLGGGQITDVANLGDPSFNVIASDTLGDIFTSSPSEGMIVRIGPDGSRTIAARLVANSIAADPSGNLFGIGPSDTIYKVAPDGTVSDYANLTTNATQALATDASGDLYALGVDSLIEITPQHVVSTLVSGLLDPLAVAFDPASAIFASQTNQGEQRFNAIDQIVNGSVVPILEYPPLSDAAGGLVASPTQVIVPEPVMTAVMPASLMPLLLFRRPGAPGLRGGS